MGVSQVRAVGGWIVDGGARHGARGCDQGAWRMKSALRAYRISDGRSRRRQLYVGDRDRHLYNFGAYATPERRLVFDINDLDETLPAPWEWDVKRLAASFVLASRENGFSRGDANDAALSCVRSYRQRMAEYSDMTILEVWYASIDIERMISGIEDAETRRRDLRRLAAGRASSMSERHFPKIVIRAGQSPTIQDNPPLIDTRALGVKTRSTFSSGSLLPTTGNHCRKTDVRFSTVLILRMPRSRWSGSAASAPGAAWCS